MYLLGVILGRYLDWCLRKTAHFPKLWLFGIAGANIPIVLSLSGVGMVGLSIWLVVLLLEMPLFFAAFKNECAAKDRNFQEMAQFKKMDQLLRSFHGKDV